MMREFWKGFFEGIKYVLFFALVYLLTSFIVGLVRAQTHVCEQVNKFEARLRAIGEIKVAEARNGDGTIIFRFFVNPDQGTWTVLGENSINPGIACAIQTGLDWQFQIPPKGDTL